MFRIGQKVTQINPFHWHGWKGEALPQFGIIYTIRTINIHYGLAFLRFYEIQNPSHAYTDGTFEMDFVAKCFRPIVDRATDISIFTEMLKDEKTDA